MNVLGAFSACGRAYRRDSGLGSRVASRVCEAPHPDDFAKSDIFDWMISDGDKATVSSAGPPDCGTL
jgi:hypothetical protein